MVAPWTFLQAQVAYNDAREVQEQAEQYIRTAACQYAEAEKAYRVALALKITELHSDGVAWSSTSDLARGDEKIAQLKFERDIAKGEKEAATQAAWAAAGRRREVEQLAAWSMRRDLAEDPPEPAQMPTFGGKAA